MAWRAASLLSRLITGEKCPWAEFYDPSRVTLSAAKNFIVENVTAVKNFAEYIAPGELKSVDELKPGQGRHHPRRAAQGRGVPR